MLQKTSMAPILKCLYGDGTCLFILHMYLYLAVGRLFLKLPQISCSRFARSADPLCGLRVGGTGGACDANWLRVSGSLGGKVGELRLMKEALVVKC